MVRLLAALILVASSGCGPRPATAIMDSGNRYFDRGNYERAAAEFAEVIERYPGDWSAHYMYGLSELQLKQPAKARTALEVAQSLRPGDPGVVDALAEAMFQEGSDAELFTFLKGQAESERSVRAYMRWAQYSLELGDPDSARAANQTAIMIDEGETVEPYLQAAIIAEQLGDVDEALRRLRQAYGIDPADSRVTDRLRALGEVPGPTIALPPGA